MGAELFRQRALVRPACDGDGAVAGLRSILNGEVAEASDAEDGDGVADAGSTVAQGIKGCDTGTEERAGIRVFQGLGDERDGIGGSDDVVGIAAVVLMPEMGWFSQSMKSPRRQGVQ